MSPRTLMGCTAATERLVLIFKQSWWLDEVPEDSRKENVAPNFKKDPGSYRLPNLTLMPRQVMEQVILENISRDMEDTKVVGRSPHGFPKAKFNLE